jgi:hypothetical protein
MSISAVSGLSSLCSSAETTNSPQGSNFFSTFQQLASALQSGNLSSAQQAYNSLSQLMQNAPNGQSNSAFAKAFNALGQALQSGNLSSAQQAFLSLQQDMLQGLAGHGHHHHDGGGGMESTANNSSSNVSDSLFTSLSSTGNNSSANTSNSSTDSETNNLNTLLNLLA